MTNVITPNKQLSIKNIIFLHTLITLLLIYIISQNLPDFNTWNKIFINIGVIKISNGGKKGPAASMRSAGNILFSEYVQNAWLKFYYILRRIMREIIAKMLQKRVKYGIISVFDVR